MSIAIACDIEGFELVVTEKDKEYFDSAVARFREYKKQPNLFEPQHFEQPKQAELL